MYMCIYVYVYICCLYVVCLMSDCVCVKTIANYEHTINKTSSWELTKEYALLSRQKTNRFFPCSFPFHFVFPISHLRRQPMLAPMRPGFSPRDARAGGRGRKLAARNRARRLRRVQRSLARVDAQVRTKCVSAQPSLM